MLLQMDLRLVIKNIFQQVFPPLFQNKQHQSSYFGLWKFKNRKMTPLQLGTEEYLKFHENVKMENSHYI